MSKERGDYVSAGRINELKDTLQGRSLAKTRSRGLGMRARGYRLEEKHQ